MPTPNGRFAMTATLHIEHAITDAGTWLAAFAQFGEARSKAGVLAQRVHQPIDDDEYIYVELDFPDIEHAEAFKQFLETRVWSSPDASPGLAGAPMARILRTVDVPGD
jgi:hypothetical protein